MSKWDHITDEEELHKLMSAAEDFEERKAIRMRLRELRDKQREEWEAKKKAREAEAKDVLQEQVQRAEELKKKKLEAYKQMGPTHERESTYQSVSSSIAADKQLVADQEKAKTMQAYQTISETKTGPGGEKISMTTTTSTQKTPGGGTRTVVMKKTETSSSSGFGGVSYGKPAAPRPGPGSARAAFAKMDSASHGPGGPPKAKPLARSPSAIKQVLLDWAKRMTAGYPNVEVTNFSSSWNNGMAFCALIHHFFPDAFDFNKLEPKARRYNFTLAFDTAEEKADIAPLLDVDDMVKMKNPDWKCVFTYVQSIYRHLKDHERNCVGAPPSEQ